MLPLSFFLLSSGHLLSIGSGQRCSRAESRNSSKNLSSTILRKRLNILALNGLSRPCLASQKFIPLIRKRDRKEEGDVSIGG